MADVFGFPNFELHEYMWGGGDGYIATGLSGAVLNDGTHTNVWGETLGLPRGITSVVRNSTGNYTFTLTDQWYGIAPVIVPISPTPTFLHYQIVNQNPRGVADSNGVAAQTFTVQFFNSSGAAADPDRQGGFNIFLRLKNTAVLA